MVTTGCPEILLRPARASGMDRHAFVIIIGGGAVLDMAGYAAGTTHRGLRVIRVPTTVLSQGDGGVGVKTGINAHGVKNFLGTFTPPFAVINDRQFLRTLPRRDALAGVAEAVKVAIIRDASFFESMERRVAAIHSADTSTIADVVEQAARLHLTHIAQGDDPFEFGTSRPLDLGHWSAHKLEMLTQGELRHGEAVAIGMAIDTRYAEQSGLLSTRELERVVGLLEGVGLATWHPGLDQIDGHGAPAVLAGLDEFREHLGGELTLIMPEAIGRVTEIHAVDTDRMLDAIAWLKERAG